jgi:hypothetical protein
MAYTTETVLASKSRLEADSTADMLRYTFPELADAIIVTGDNDSVIDYDAPPRFFVELREHGRTVADCLWAWLHAPRLDDLGTAYHRARVAYEIGVIDAPAFAAWMRENELA